jgi:hypothetical protein
MKGNLRQNPTGVSAAIGLGGRLVSGWRGSLGPHDEIVQRDPQGLRETTESGAGNVDVAVFVGGDRRGADSHLRPQDGLLQMPAQPPPADVIGDAYVSGHCTCP